MPTNEERCEQATVACDAYAGFKREDPTDEGTIADLITDLLHLCEQRGGCVESLLATAKMHYDAESSRRFGRESV